MTSNHVRTVTRLASRLVLPLVASVAFSSVAWGQQNAQPESQGPCSGIAATITITSPTQGQSLAPGVTSVNVTGSLTNVHSGGTLVSSWYIDGTAKGSLSAGNFTLPLSGLSVGSHQVEITASVPGTTCIGAYSNNLYRQFNIVEAAAPTISVSAPATTNYPAAVPLTASIVANYTVSSVKWYVDSTLVNTTTASPYSYSWPGGSLGSHSVYAIVTDAMGQTGTSSTQSFAIAYAAAPSVTMSASPTSTTAPGTVALSASPVSAYSISRVDYLLGGNVIGTATASPWSYSWTGSTVNGVTGIAPGTYQVTARATDVYGQQGTSSATTVTVNPASAPTVSVTAVTNCATLPATITMNATVSSSYTVSSLKFLVNGTSYPVTAGATGSYQLPVPTTGGWGSAATYAVSATAANAWSSTGTSNTVNVAEAAHPAPTITLNSVETTDDVPAEIAVGTTPVDTVCGNNYIASVQLRLNGTLQATATTAPYNFLINGAAPNTTYAATVQATNQGGQTSGFSAPQSVTTPASDPTVTGDSKSQTRTTEYEYDPTFGRLNKTMVEPESSDLCLVTTVAYDPVYGIPTSTTTRNCDSTQDAKEAVAPTDYSKITARTSQVTYDSTHTFPSTKTNALNQSSSATFDARFGTPLTQTDVNGLSQTTMYDAFGRPTQITAADGTITKIQYLWCSGVNGGTTSCPTYGASLIQSTAYAANGTTQIGATKVVYYDALQRPIQNQTQGFSGAAIIATTSYDAQGRVAQKSVPYYSSGGTPTYTTTTYDVLNRKTQTTGPTGSTFTYSYNGLEQTRTDFYGRSFTRTINSRKQVVSVVDPAAQVSTYQYDPFGNMILMVDPQGVTKTMVYDLRGNKVSMLDPDIGGALPTPVAWIYKYDAAAELVGQTDANGQSSSMTYDVLGRMLTRTEPDLTSYWEYDTARSECSGAPGKAIGLADRAWTNNNYSRIDCVDSLERPVQERTTIGPTTYVSSVAYNANSQPITATYPAGSVYPAGFSVTSSYNAYGYLTQRTNTTSGAVIWQATAMDALGDVTNESMAAGAFTSTKAFDVLGRLTASSAGSSNAIQNDSFVYDQKDGDLTSRGWEDNSGTQYSETFGYDQLDRLASVTGPSNKTYAYDYSGNFTSKSDVGTYTYNPGTHQVSSITGTVNGVTNPTFAYDNNGNLTAEDGVTTVWSSFNMANSITRGSASDTFVYNSEHSRAKEVAVSSSGTTTTYYVSSSFEVVTSTATGTTEYHNYINSPSRRVAMLIDSTASTTSWRYFHQDQVGSIDVVTDQTGAVVERLSYDAFGRRRNTNGTDSASFIQALDSYGYTDQEEMDNIGLINMNGRVYDPTIARFMSADPTISRPFDLQSHNRYSYVSNRPFTSIDPTGFVDNVNSDTQGADTPPTQGGGGVISSTGAYGTATATPIYGSDGTTLVGYGIDASGVSGAPQGGASGVGGASGNAGSGGMCLGCSWTVTFGNVPGQPADPSSGLNLIGAAPSGISGQTGGGVAQSTGATGSNLLTAASGAACAPTCSDAPSASGMLTLGTGAALAPGAGVAQPINWGNILDGLAGLGSVLANVAQSAAVPLVGVALAAYPPDTADDSLRTYYHGTSASSVPSIMLGLNANLASAAQNWPGSSGFYMSNYSAAQYYAEATETANPTVIQVQMTGNAYRSLVSAGAQTNSMAYGNAMGTEFVVPVSAFPIFNSLYATGAIRMTPVPK
jgi:RHS repeat-associated protein